MSEFPPSTHDQIAHDIRVLKGLEAIRLRPGMYLGSVPAAIYDMLHNVLNYSVNEAMAGLCNHIEIVIHPDSSVTVSDNSPGLSVAIHPDEKISALEIELTMLLACGRFESDRYFVTGGMHGVGLKAVQACSEWFIAEVRRDGYLWRQTYARGERTSDLIQVRPLNGGEPTGNTLTFFIDAEIFNGVRTDYDFNFDVIAERCRQITYTLHGMTIQLVDERVIPVPHKTIFHVEGGLETYISDLNYGRVPLHKVISGTKTVQFETDRHQTWNIEVDFAFQYTADKHTAESMFVNTLETRDDGTPRTGLRAALTRTINKWARKNGYLKLSDISFKGQETRKGLTAVVSIKHPNPHFQSMTRLKLMNPEVNSIVASAIEPVFAQTLEANPEQARRILDNFRTTAHLPR